MSACDVLSPIVFGLTILRYGNSSACLTGHMSLIYVSFGMTSSVPVCHSVGYHVAGRATITLKGETTGGPVQARVWGSGIHSGAGNLGEERGSHCALVV